MGSKIGKRPQLHVTVKDGVMSGYVDGLENEEEAEAVVKRINDFIKSLGPRPPGFSGAWVSPRGKGH
jgi:hypothetical protein